MKLLLCPAQFQLAGCELVAAKEVEAGTVFHPWSGQLCCLVGNFVCHAVAILGGGRTVLSCF